MIHDLSNQLIRVQNNGTTVAEYVYNGIGQRIKKNAQGSVRVFHYNQMGYLISETTETGQTLVEYIYIGSNLLAKIQGEQVHYYHNDHLGTPQVLTDDSATIAWKAVYTPFGEAAASVQTVDNPFRLPGQYYDQETGLHYNYFRYYNPQTGRYITPDPIGLEGGINLFTYVDNDPINWIDPWGLAPLSFEDISNYVSKNNKSGQSNELIICLMWKESRFNPAAKNPTSSATGLMQVTKDAAKDTGYEHSKMTDPVSNTQAGSKYLGLRIKWQKGDLTKGLEGYGTGAGYAADILECEKCMKENPCNKKDCLKKIKN